MSDNNNSDDNRPDLRYGKDLIEMRRAKTLELLSKGLTGADISRELNVSRSLVCLDIQFLKEQAQEELRTHIQERIPFEYQRSRQAINDLIKKANEILDNNSDDPKLQLQVINVLTNLWMANSNINSEGSIIEQAYRKVQTLEEIQKRNSEEAVFSDEDISSDLDGKEDAEPEPAKITTIDDQDTPIEPEEEEETEEE